jgi:hypothetical protein
MQEKLARMRGTYDLETTLEKKTVLSKSSGNKITLDDGTT